jgi:hypothetical protein
VQLVKQDLTVQLVQLVQIAWYLVQQVQLVQQAQ